jgi:hypothetical protein
MLNETEDMLKIRKVPFRELIAEMVQYDLNNDDYGGIE